MSQLLAFRYSEPFSKAWLGASSQGELIWASLTRFSLLPIDHAMDCVDVFELATGAKGLAADKTQRLVVMSIREDRLSRRLRTLMHLPTAVMLADGLMKCGVFRQLLHYATTGIVMLEIGHDKYVRLRTRQLPTKDFIH